MSSLKLASSSCCRARSAVNVYCVQQTLTLPVVTRQQRLSDPRKLSSTRRFLLLHYVACAPEAGDVKHILVLYVHMKDIVPGGAP
mmetsp:Transcript_4628/g.9278  ORF Transcript_4628/g.9278 Transcript_4628/m.9278 type:complete len:85 (-) Transcript_4628:270-524(-)